MHAKRSPERDEFADSLLINESEFPLLYQAANTNSVRRQRWFLTAVRLRLAALIVAAAIGGFTILVGGKDLAGVIAAVSFGIALVTELYLLKARPERTWYDGRAAAESAKTLTWRFIVGGRPFGKEETTDGDSECLLLERFRQVAAELPGVHLVPIAQDGHQITAAMRRARASSLDARRELYRVGRIDNQHRWYATKARWNERRADAWAVILAALEVVGLTGAILKASAVFEIDVLGLAAVLVAAGAAWIQTKQHDTLARAYAVAALELAEIHARIAQPFAEDEWADFVDQAEEAISREHTLWRASHS